MWLLAPTRRLLTHHLHKKRDAVTIGGYVISRSSYKIATRNSIHVLNLFLYGILISFFFFFYDINFFSILTSRILRNLLSSNRSPSIDTVVCA